MLTFKSQHLFAIVYTGFTAQKLPAVLITQCTDTILPVVHCCLRKHNGMLCYLLLNKNVDSIAVSVAYLVKHGAAVDLQFCICMCGFYAVEQWSVVLNENISVVLYALENRSVVLYAFY